VPKSVSADTMTRPSRCARSKISGSLADGLGGELERLADVVALEIWVGLEDLSLRHPLGHIPTIVATGIRRPRMQGIPPIWFGSTVIRLNGCTAITSPGSRASREYEGGAGLVGGLLIRPLPPDPPPRLRPLNVPEVNVSHGP